MSRSREELHDAMRELSARRRQGFGDTGTLEGVADVSTIHDWHMLREATEALDDFGQMVVDLHSDMTSEFNRGFRCSVCGNTPAQSKAINYDCVRGC